MAATRRELFKTAAAGAALALGSRAAFAAPEGKPRRSAPAVSGSTFVHPYAKLAKLGPKRVQFWPVVYLNADKKVTTSAIDPILAQVDASMENGADAVVLINEWGEELAVLDRVLGELKKKRPSVTFGVNYLGDDDEPYGWRGSFKLAKTHGLPIVWTDFSGVDLIKERPKADLHAMQAERPAEVFWCSGVHMKYSTLLDPNKTIEQSALEAMGWIDGIIVTGPKTGVASDPEHLHRARAVIGDYPLGVASGTSAENVGGLLEWIDFALVNTHISNDHVIDPKKVKALRAALDALDK